MPNNVYINTHRANMNFKIMQSAATKMRNQANLLPELRSFACTLEKRFRVRVTMGKELLLGAVVLLTTEETARRLLRLK